MKTYATICTCITNRNKSETHILSNVHVLHIKPILSTSILLRKPRLIACFFTYIFHTFLNLHIKDQGILLGNVILSNFICQYSYRIYFLESTSTCINIVLTVLYQVFLYNFLVQLV